jgi:hypothetical protein
MSPLIRRNSGVERRVDVLDHGVVDVAFDVGPVDGLRFRTVRGHLLENRDADSST